MEIIFLKKMWDYWGDKYKYVMYENIRNKVKKFYSGGLVQNNQELMDAMAAYAFASGKSWNGGGISDWNAFMLTDEGKKYANEIEKALNPQNNSLSSTFNANTQYSTQQLNLNYEKLWINGGLGQSEFGINGSILQEEEQKFLSLPLVKPATDPEGNKLERLQAPSVSTPIFANTTLLNAETGLLSVNTDNLTQELSAVNAGIYADLKQAFDTKQKSEARATGIANTFGVDSEFIGTGKGQMSAKGAAATGVIANVGVGAMNAVDLLAMGDKNFGALSQAIDSTVHATSGALMLSGNPYAFAVGAALEGANFLTKAGGLTVQGFDANINSSGYGTLGHMESSSSRDFGAMIGLGGLFTGNVDAKLARRNELARMALTAASIANDQSFEQEARMNSVENTIMNNQIALAGGLDTNMIAG